MPLLPAVHAVGDLRAARCKSCERCLSSVESRDREILHPKTILVKGLRAWRRPSREIKGSPLLLSRRARQMATIERKTSREEGGMGELGGGGGWLLNLHCAEAGYPRTPFA